MFVLRHKDGYYFKKLDRKAELTTLKDADVFRREGSAQASLRSTLQLHIQKTHKTSLVYTDFKTIPVEIKLL